MATIRQAEFESLPQGERLAYERAMKALRAMGREDLDLRTAAALEHTTSAEVERYFGDALDRDATGRRVVRRDHEVPMPFKVPQATGTRLVWVSDPATRSLLAGYANAVDASLAGNPSALQPFEGRTITVEEERVTLLTDVDALADLARAGEIGFEELYELT